MSLLSLIAVFLIEQLQPLDYRRIIAERLGAWADFIESRFNAGAFRHGVLAWCLAVLLPVALVGGVYAPGYLEPFKEWMRALDKYKVFSLVDFALSTEGLVKGDRVMEAMKELVPDVQIERMPVPSRIGRRPRAAPAACRCGCRAAMPRWRRRACRCCPRSIRNR